MTERSSQPVQNYLSRLDSALAGVEPDVRVEIVSGIREELAGLDDEAAAARVAEMDDPALIAAEARAEQPAVGTESAAGAAEPAPGRTLSLVAVLVLIIGSFVVPVIGPLVGLVWVTLSRAWSWKEKLVMWLAPIAAAIVVVAVLAVTTATGQAGSTQTTEPVLPFGFASGHLALLVLFIVLPIEGVVLLIRAHGRAWRPGR